MMIENKLINFYVGRDSYKSFNFIIKSDHNADEVDFIYKKHIKKEVDLQFALDEFYLADSFVRYLYSIGFDFSMFETDSEVEPECLDDLLCAEYYIEDIDILSDVIISIFFHYGIELLELGFNTIDVDLFEGISDD